MTNGVDFGDSAETVLISGYFPGTQLNAFYPVILDEPAQVSFAGTLALDSVFEISQLPITGTVLPVFFDDWYNRIHVIPLSIDLFNVVTNQTRSITLWNAYLSTKSLVSTDFPSEQGLSVTSPVNPPYSIRPLEVLEYTLSVTTDGPPTINVDLTWNIDAEDAIVVPVTGRRVIVWPFKPNWSQGLVESLEWLSDVMTSYSGDEQRFSLRTKPRRIFEYASVVQKEEAAIATNLLWGWQNRNFAVPVWFDKTMLNAPVSAGADTISVDTTDRGFFVDGLLLLINSVTDYEAIQIESFTSSSVVLAKPLERSWPAGTKVYPLNVARMPQSVNSTRLTDGVLNINTVFNADPVQTDPYIPVAAASTTFNGYEVILRKPNWARPVEIENNYEYDLVDFQVGGVASVTTTTFPKVIRRFQWDLYSNDEVREFRQLLGRLKGRAKAAYLPTWFAEFELYSTEVASSSTIRVKDNEFYRVVNVDPALKTLMILPRTGAPIIRSIDSVGIDPLGFITLGLNAAIGIDLNATTLSRLSLVHLCRLTADRVIINWVSDRKATVEANFTLVKA